ncbi:hypothetical protein [Viridibacillus arvi]|uniref:hypothetical protein n=1 Tax=Viridibacillus arvi TaxID=263475 RepID=UPI003D2C9D42
MKETILVCMQNEEHAFIYKGTAVDGLNCPQCRGPVIPYGDASKAPKWFTSKLSTYTSKQYMKAARNVEEIEPPANYIPPTERKRKTAITVEVDANTNKLSAKLKAISKHTQALADELEAIDKHSCPECNKPMKVETFYSNEVIKSQTATCECGYVMGIDLGKSE